MPHIMISYQWDVQKTLIQVKKLLQQSGYKVWMDVDQMQGSTLEAMAKAVENSALVLVCISSKYKESPNCRSEAEYAFQLKKNIIPLMVEKNFKPSGWLGMVVGAKLWYDFAETSRIQETADKLMKELKTRVPQAIVGAKPIPAEEGKKPANMDMQKRFPDIVNAISSYKLTQGVRTEQHWESLKQLNNAGPHLTCTFEEKDEIGEFCVAQGLPERIVKDLKDFQTLFNNELPSNVISSLWKNIRYLFLITVNYTYGERPVSKGLVDHGIVPVLIFFIKHFRGKSDDSHEGYIVKLCVEIMVNLSRAVPPQALNNTGVVDALIPFVKSTNKSMAVASLIALAAIVDEDQNDLLMANPANMDMQKRFPDIVNAISSYKLTQGVRTEQHWKSLKQLNNARPHHTCTFEEKDEIGEFCVSQGLPKRIVKDLKEFQTLFNESPSNVISSLWNNIYYLLLTTLNYTDGERPVSKGLVDHGIVPVLIFFIKKIDLRGKSDDSRETYIVKLCVEMMVNMSRVVPPQALNNTGVVDALIPFVKSPNKSMAVPALVALAAIVDEDQNDLLMANPGEQSILFYYLLCFYREF
ncbi:hypothetical protein AC249_AIPGENE25222 [Exaiptasia diaphana]|nr:hypothetical protein AC249_AIPGENE25222 [Exaiptasia diaphana]